MPNVFIVQITSLYTEIFGVEASISLGLKEALYLPRVTN